MSRTDRTEILPVVKQRGLTASPLLLAAGAVAVTLILGVGGWALLGNRSGGDPLVFPWSADKPGDINVSVSMVPTTDASPSEQDSPSPAQSSTVQRSTPPQQVPLSPVPNPSRSPGSSATATAKVASVSGWDGNVKINVDVQNTGSTPLATWSVELYFDKALNVGDLWNAKVQVVGDRVHLKFTAEQPLAAGATVSFGFIASYPGNRQPRMQTCQIDGLAFSCQAG